jgi:hypothetical protein
MNSVRQVTQVLIVISTRPSVTSALLERVIDVCRTTHKQLLLMAYWLS